MIRKFSISLIFPFILCLLISLVTPVVEGSWVAGSYSGVWVSKSDSAWESDNSGADALFIYTYADFNMTTGYDCWLHADTLTVAYNWWEVWTVRTIKQMINITLTNSGNFITVSYTKQLDMRGSFAHILFTIKVIDNSGVTDWSSDFAIDYFDLDTTIDPLRVYFFHQGAVLNLTVLAMGIANNPDTYYKSKSLTKNMGSSWFGDLDITLSVKKDVDNADSGHIEGYKTEHFNTYSSVQESGINEVGWLERIWGAITSPIYNVLPDWLKGFVNYTVSLFTPLYDLLVSAWAVFLVIIPFLPIVLIAWIADAGVASVREGSFVPIGNVFGSILTTAQSIGSWLISIAQAVWDLLTFWS